MFTILPGNGINNLPYISIVSTDETFSCTVYLFGCTVTSWKHQGTEMLFVSPTTPFNGVKAIRGGIPLVFPQFGQPNSIMPQHGFARSLNWTFESELIDSNSATVVFSLTDTDETFSVWPHRFKLEFTVSLSISGLKTKMAIKNVDDQVFQCQALLHTYIAVPLIQNLAVKGFYGQQYVDKMRPSSSVLQSEQRELITIAEEVDRIYVPTAVPLPSIELIHINSDLNGRCVYNLKIDHSAYVIKNRDATMEEDCQLNIPTDVVLWNAWIDKSKVIADLEDDAYLRYVCVEPGLVAKLQSVEVGQTLVLEQFLTV